MSGPEELAGLIAEGVLGKQVEEFLVSDVGRYLVKRAESEADAAMDSLKRCPPEKTELIRQYQSDIARAESIQQWLADAVIKGLQAIHNIDERE